MAACCARVCGRIWACTKECFGNWMPGFLGSERTDLRGMESMPVISQSFGAAAGRQVHFIIRSTEDPLQYDGPNVIHGLSGSPKKISSVYVYDKTGMGLF